jgi:hypothetical protein
MTVRWRLYRVVQPWGPDKVRQATVISQHHTVAGAFDEIDGFADQMVRNGVPANAVELFVLDAQDRVVARPNIH